MKRVIICIAFVSHLVVLTSQAAAAVEGCENPSPLRFALIPRNDIVKQLEEHRPLLLHLERALGRKIKVVQPSSYGSVIEGLLAGMIDLASMGPGSYSLARNRDPSITPIVTWTMQGGTFVKKGADSYKSLLITRRDSGFNSIDDLKRQRISLTDPASTSGGVLPRAEFGREIGRRLEDFAGSVTYSGSHDRSIAALKKGQVDAAFVASEHLDQAIREGRIAADEINVLWESTPIPHDPFVLHGRLCPELKEKIRDAFMADTVETRTMLRNLNAERFVPVGDEAYRQLRDILSNEK